MGFWLRKAVYDAATTYYVNATDRTTATIYVPGTLASPLTITPTSSTAGVLSDVVVPAGSNQTATLAYTNTNNQVLSFTNGGGLTNPQPMCCPQVFIDPRGVEGTGADGTGNSALDPKLALTSSPAANTTYSFAEDSDSAPVEHTLPTSGGNSYLSLNATHIRFETHNRTPAVVRTRVARLSGAVDIGGSFSATTINGVDVYSYTHGAAQYPVAHWVIDRQPTYITRTAPDYGDTTYSSLHYGGVNEYLVGLPGWCTVLFADVSTTLNTTSKISSNSSGTCRFRAPNFWATVNAIQSPVGLTVRYRGTSNIIGEATITSYDSVNGLVECSYPTGYRPEANSASGCFWALVGHPIGIVRDGQYAWSSDNLTSYLRWDGDDLTTLPATQRRFVSRQLLILAPNSSASDFWLNRYGDTVLTDIAAQLIVGTTRVGGVDFQAPTSADGSFAGNVTVRNQQSVLEQAGSGVAAGVAVTAFGVGVITEECYTQGYPLRIGGTTVVTASGPRGNMAKLRVGGSTTGPVAITGTSAAPQVSVHRNVSTTYETATDVTHTRMAIAGSNNPIAMQYQDGVVSGTTSPTNRAFDRVVAYGLAPVSGGATSETNNVSRIDNGFVGGVIDRPLYLGAQSFFGATTDNFLNMTIKRGVIQDLRTTSAVSTHFNGCLFEDLVFLASGAIAYLQARGATATFTNCIDGVGSWTGSFSEEMWKRITTNDARSGYEDVPMFPPQWGIADIPAYNAGLSRPINPLHLECRDLEAGMPAGLHVASVFNPNPLTTLSLPAGVYDNDLFASTLWGNYGLRLAAQLPAQASYTLAVDILDGIGGGTTRQTIELPVMS